MRIIFTTIGQLLAAIPAMLGFVPTRSIVYVLLRAGIVTVSARVDAHGASTIAPRIAEPGRHTPTASSSSRCHRRSKHTTRPGSPERCSTTAVCPPT